MAVADAVLVAAELLGELVDALVQAGLTVGVTMVSDEHALTPPRRNDLDEVLARLPVQRHRC